MVYLLVVSMLTGLAYAAWRLYRASASAPRPRVVGPDDDPEFLRRLAEEQRETAAADRELLSKWEMDLRRREEELRKQDGKDA